MSITVGAGTQGADKRVLRLTLSEADEKLARSYWGDGQPRIWWEAEALSDGRWLLSFRKRGNGNVPAIHKLPGGSGGDREYLTWSWSLRDNEIPGLPSIRKKAHKGELLRWTDDGVLEIVVRGDKPKLKRAPKPKPAPQPDQGNAVTHRLAALRRALNVAITDLNAQGIRARVEQTKPGEEVFISLDL